MSAADGSSADVSLADLGLPGLHSLEAKDPLLAQLLRDEQQRQGRTLSLVASSGLTHPSVYAAQSLGTDNLTTEGMPGRRFHAGAAVADQIERLAAQRACHAFGAGAALVQPHSGTSANYLTIMTLCEPGDGVLSMSLKDGGHLSHGAPPSLLHRYADVHHYGLGRHARVDYDQVRELARQHHPKVIIAGASSYPRIVDYRAFRDIADEVNAFLIADISHVAGLVAAGLHPSPVDTAHVTTTSTYKQLAGPRGGLILLGNRQSGQLPAGPDLLKRLEFAVFPFFQGTPSIAAIAAKARALEMISQPEFKIYAEQISLTAKTFAAELASRGYELVTGGTDTHMILLSLDSRKLSGIAAQDILESCSIIVNKNLVPGDKRSAATTSGLRIGTNTFALRGMQSAEAAEATRFMDMALSSPGDAAAHQEAAKGVEDLCSKFPLYGPRSWAGSA